MSIKSDRWIKSKCRKPTHILMDGRLAYAGFTHTPEELSGLVTSGFALVATDDLLAELRWHPMIVPFEPKQCRGVQSGAISYGTSSYGYDVRAANEWKVFTNINSTVVDPKAFDTNNFVDVTTDRLIIPPNSFALGRTVEYFRIPRDVLTICLGKSTYARCGIIVNVTPLEPEWEGHVTLEFSNTTPLPAVIHANEGVAQMLFLQSDEACEVSYKDRGGKYQGQTGVVLPRM